MFFRSKLSKYINDACYRCDQPKLKKFLPLSVYTPMNVFLKLQALNDDPKITIAIEVYLNYINTHEIEIDYSQELTYFTDMTAWKKTYKDATDAIKFRINSLPNEKIRLLDFLSEQIVSPTYIVGGFTRDAINPKLWDRRRKIDVDITTTANLIKILAVLSESEWEAKIVGKDHPIVVATHKETKDITTITSISSESNLMTDAEHRDFTNSCVYYDISNERLEDPLGCAIDDAVNGILRFVGIPKDRLMEDPLRIFRFHRFIRYGWTPNISSLKAVRSSWDETYRRCSPARVLQEMEKAFHNKTAK